MPFDPCYHQACDDIDNLKGAAVSSQKRPEKREGS